MLEFLILLHTLGWKSGMLAWWTGGGCSAAAVAVLLVRALTLIARIGLTLLVFGG